MKAGADGKAGLCDLSYGGRERRPGGRECYRLCQKASGDPSGGDQSRNPSRKDEAKREKQDHGGVCFRRDPGTGIYHSCGGWSECAKCYRHDGENAERFGLAQLHQLRGRVGRGEHQSYCIFIQGNNEENTSKRLKILNESNDGFYIAGEDLKLRGPGDLFGIRQSGLMEFKIGDIYNDAGILKNASEAAGEILALDFDLILPQHKALKEHLKGYMSEELENLGI